MANYQNTFMAVYDGIHLIGKSADLYPEYKLILLSGIQARLEHIIRQVHREAENERRHLNNTRVVR